jgi:hypothetical protein
MKLLSSLHNMRQVKEEYKEITDADFVEINKRLIAQGGVIKRGESGELRVSTEGDATLTQVGRKAPRKKVSEASALHDVEIEDTSDKPSVDGQRTADQLEIGDVVEITGNVQYKDQTGEITRFGKDKKFVVVKLYGIGEHSFHSSDVSEAEKDYEETDEDGDDEDDQQKFYVAFYDEDEERSWIGLVTKEGGGKWHEKQYKGKPEYRWGQTYMSYLKPDDIMSWIHKDYRRGIDIEGPFYDAKEAEHHVTSNWGKLEEAVGGSTLKKAIAAALTAAKKDGTLNDATHGRKSGVRSSVIAMAKELSDVAGDKKKFVAIYNKWNDSFGGITDLLADELFKQYGAETFKEFLVAAFKTPIKEAKKEEAKPLAPDLPQTPDLLHAAIKRAGEKLAKVDWITDFEEKPMVKRMMNQLAAVTKDKKRFGEIYNNWLATEPEIATIFADELFLELGAKNIAQVIKHHFVTEDDSLDAMGALDILASAHHGTMFRLLEASEAAQLVDFKKANELAAPYGKARFWTLSPADMEALVNEHPEVLIGQAAALLMEGKPNKDEEYRKLALEVIHEADNYLHHMAEEELIACKVHRIEPIGNVLKKGKFKKDSEVTVAFYTDCKDKPRKEGLQKDLSEKLRARLALHPLKSIGGIDPQVIHEDVDGGKLKEDAHDSWKDVESWKTAVKNAYPEKAAKLKFKAKIENGVRTISAEVSDEDRSYGVWDMDEKKGYVLGESVEKGDLYRVTVEFGPTGHDHVIYEITAKDPKAACEDARKQFLKANPSMKGREMITYEKIAAKKSKGA